MSRKSEQAKQIERAVADAILAGDFDLAARTAAGHPDAAQHLELMKQIDAARRGPPGATDAATEDQSAPGNGSASGSDAASPPIVGFHLRRARASLAHVNVRAEKHGAEQVPCVDVKFATIQPSDVLDRFDPSLRDLLFHKSTSPQDLADQAHDSPNLRLPDLDPIGWRRKLVGATVTIHYGIDDRSAIVLDGCAVDGFKIAPQEGGTVVVTFTAKATRPAGDAIGKIGLLVKHEIEVSVVPPAAGWHVEPDDDDEDDDGEPFGA